MNKYTTKDLGKAFAYHAATDWHAIWLNAARCLAAASAGVVLGLCTIAVLARLGMVL